MKSPIETKRGPIEKEAMNAISPKGEILSALDEQSTQIEELIEILSKLQTRLNPIKRCVPDRPQGTPEYQPDPAFSNVTAHIALNTSKISDATEGIKELLNVLAI